MVAAWVGTWTFTLSGQEEKRAADLDRQRLIGKAYYENDDFKTAAVAFRRCIELAPDSAGDHFNLALSLLRGRKYREALRLLEKAQNLDPELLNVHYIRGIVHKRTNAFREAVESLNHVVKRDSRCFGAYYNLGACYKYLEDFKKAKEAFKTAIRLAPRHPSSHYQMITLARRTGDVEEAKRHTEIYNRLKGTVEEAEKTIEALERSRYSDLISVPRLCKGLEPAPGADVRFVDVTVESGLAEKARTPEALVLPARLKRIDYNEEAVRVRYALAVGSAVTLEDVDNDGDLDVYVVRCGSTPEDSENRLYCNDGAGRFTDVTAGFGVGDSHRGMDAVFGDYDNDGHIDLYVVNDGPNALFRKLGDGVFEVTGVERKGENGVAVLDFPGLLPDRFVVEADFKSEDISGQEKNAFVVFDFKDPGHFKFAGANVADGYWTIGHFDGSWVNDARLDSALTTKKSYRFHLRFDGGTVALKLIGASGEKVLSHDFGVPVNRGRIGLAVEHATSRFDNVQVGVSGKGEGKASPGSPGRTLYSERFLDGTAKGFTAVSGTWRVVDWTFENVSERARVDEPQLGRKAVFFDFDHDNDLDLFVVNDVELADPPDRDEFVLPGDFPGQVNTMLRNNGNGTFSDITDEAGLLVDQSRSRDVLFADFEGDADTDLFVANANAASFLFTNARLGRFTTGGSFTPPIHKDARAAMAADVDRDGHLDLVVASANALHAYVNNGRAVFQGTPVPLPAALSTSGVATMALIDFNNDGWSDLLASSVNGNSLCLLAATGPARFRDVSARVGLGKALGQIADLAVGDVDGDGDEDIVIQTRNRGPRLLENRGGNGRSWLEVHLVGRKSNRSGHAAVVEVARAGHYQKLSADRGWIHFGLGGLDRLDVVRVTWPNGVAQNVIAPPVNIDLTIKERVKVSASCGFLWAHDGNGFALINEILGIGPLGVPMAPGLFHQPDCTELTKIEARQLVSKNGVFELRLTEELREIMYADQFTLRVVDHPLGLEIVPNEMFTAPPFPDDRFFAAAGARPPRTAVDDQGRDVLDLIRRRDGRFPTFPTTAHYDGLAENHALTIDAGSFAGGGRIMLYLDGWIFWPDSSTVMAIAQDPRYELQPLSLQVRDEQGQWRTAIKSVGLPTSKGLVVPVDLTDCFLTRDRHLRLVTNMCIYFDRIFFSSRDEASRCRVTELPVARARLHYRGFSRLERDRFGFERFHYRDVSPTGSWNPPEGMFTRYGDVTALLIRPDDDYVILGPGDELVLQFDGRGLPDLPDGWIRDFIFYANGWVKDGDLNTKFSETVEPLPYHGMPGYPYPERSGTADSRHPCNTRPMIPTVGPLPRTGGILR